MDLKDKILYLLVIAYGVLTATWLVLILAFPYATVAFMVHTIVSYAKDNYSKLIYEKWLERDLKQFNSGAMTVWIVTAKVCYFAAWVYILIAIARRYFGAFSCLSM